MNFSEKLKDIRQKQGLSQEQLAEKIGVSRQAITKWETGKGLPDIENMVILSEIFKTTLDDLIKDTAKKERVFSSDTIYDIDCERHFDIRIGSARMITLASGKDEKLHISLRSDTIEDLDAAFKIKLDPGKNKLDVGCLRRDKMSRFEAEDALDVMITLPEKFVDHVELGASVKKLELLSLHIRRLEYDGDAGQVLIRGCDGSLEFTGKSDYEMSADTVKGRIDVNQWKAKTLIHIPESNCPNVVNKGRKCGVYFMKSGEAASGAQGKSAGGEISISGMFSELIVDLT